MKTLCTRACLIALSAALLAGCEKPPSDLIQGYAEGAYVFVASPYSGALTKLNVARGAQVKAGDVLFSLEDTPEKAARDEAAKRLAQSKATLEDARKGKRPTEIESLEAQLLQAKSAAELSHKTLVRQQDLSRTGAGSIDDLDRARSTDDQNTQRIAQLEADIKTARLGARIDQVTAAESDVHAREAALAKAEWDLSQKRQKAPQDAQVFDTLYQQGEWVAAGKPVVSLLPPANMKVRAFVPETKIGNIRAGDEASVIVDGIAEPFVGKVSFVSPQAEYTPPVIYSNESRSKLVFMIELRFDPATAARLHPGQPVDVKFKR